MCRSVEQGGRRCDGLHPRSRSTVDRSREYARAKARKTGKPDPYDELDDVFARVAAMRQVAEEFLADSRQEMVAAGVAEIDVDRLMEARRQAMLDQVASLMATTEYRWTANTFTSGRGVKARRASASEAEQSATERSYDSRVAAVRVESDIVAAYARTGEDRQDTVHRLRLTVQRALPFLQPTRILDWNVLATLGHERPAKD